MSVPSTKVSGTINGSYKPWSAYKGVRKPIQGTKRQAERTIARPKKRKTYISGSGDYMIREVGSRKNDYTPFGSVGAKLGSYVGAPGIGWAGGHLLGRILGSGDYKMGPCNLSGNVLMNKTEVPQFSSSARSNIVAHREYIKDISTGSVAGAFNVETIVIQPGDGSTFPWLSTIAQNYEQYRVHGMVFEFKTTSCDALNSTNTALGTVIMATEYNVNSPAYTNKISMENSEFAQSAKPSQSQMHGVECAPAEGLVRNLFTRSAGLSSTSLALQDKRLYDLANFQIATVGGQAANIVVGELWVTYLIEFLKPQIPITLGGDLDTLKFNKNSAVATTTLDFGLIGLSATGSLGYSIVSAASFTVSKLVIGNLYEFTVAWSASAAITTLPTLSVSSGGTATAAYPTSAGVNLLTVLSTGGGAGVTTAAQGALTFTATSTSATIAITGGILTSGTFYCQGVVSGIDASITN